MTTDFLLGAIDDDVTFLKTELPQAAARAVAEVAVRRESENQGTRSPRAPRR